MNKDYCDDIDNSVKELNVICKISDLMLKLGIRRTEAINLLSRDEKYIYAKYKNKKCN